MKTFRILRNNDVVTVVELSFKDVFDFLLGRELPILTGTNRVVVRHTKCYEAFNLTAPRSDAV